MTFTWGQFQNEFTTTILYDEYHNSKITKLLPHLQKANEVKHGQP